jgi:transcription elongation factor Elf1
MPMIKLNFRSTHQEEIRLAERYWAMDDCGKFKEVVADLLPFQGIATTAKLAARVREIAQAWDENQVCPSCGSFEVVANRTDAKKSAQVMPHNCMSCREAAEIARQTEAAKATADLTVHLQAAIKRSSAQTINYDDLDDDVVFLLLALERALNPRLLNGTFMRGDCQALGPTDVGDFISKLYKARVIVDLPGLAKSGAYVLEEGQLCHYTSKVVYRLTPDQRGEEPAQSFSRLEQRDLSKPKGFRELWLDYAAAECMCYLFNQCELHGLITEAESDDEIYSNLRTALTEYSVSQLWSVIWKIIRDAATLSTRDYYSKSKAAATIPGKLRRHLEKVKRGEAKISEWDRPNEQPSRTLGELFSDRYGIDERTPGSAVMQYFSEPTVTIDDQSESPDIAATSLMNAALGHFSAIEVLSCFAKAVRGGKNISEAIDEVYETLPYLEEPY